MLPVKGHFLYYPTRGRLFSGRWTAPDMDPSPSLSLRSCLRMTICRPETKSFQNQKIHRKGLLLFWFRSFGKSSNRKVFVVSYFWSCYTSLEVFFLVCILYRASSLAPTNCPHLRLEFCVASNRLVVFDILQPDVYLVYTHGIKMTQNEVMTYYIYCHTFVKEDADDLVVERC